MASSMLSKLAQPKFRLAHQFLDRVLIDNYGLQDYNASRFCLRVKEPAMDREVLSYEKAVKQYDRLGQFYCFYRLAYLMLMNKHEQDKNAIINTAIGGFCASNLPFLMPDDEVILIYCDKAWGKLEKAGFVGQSEVDQPAPEKVVEPDLIQAPEQEAELDQNQPTQQTLDNVTFTLASFKRFLAYMTLFAFNLLSGEDVWYVKGKGLSYNLAFDYVGEILEPPQEL